MLSCNTLRPITAYFSDYRCTKLRTSRRNNQHPRFEFKNSRVGPSAGGWLYSLIFSSFRSVPPRKCLGSISNYKVFTFEIYYTIHYSFMMKDVGFESRRGTIFFLPENRSDWIQNPHSFLFIAYLVSLSGVQRPRLESDHSPPSSAAVKNEWSCTSTPLYDFTVWTGINSLPMILQYINLPSWDIAKCANNPLTTYQYNSLIIVRGTKLFRYFLPAHPYLQKFCTLFRWGIIPFQYE